jgi:hypothetical protein
VTRIITIGAALAAAMFAQDPVPDKAQVRVEVRGMIQDKLEAAMGQTFEFIGGQLLGGNPVKGQPYSAEAVTESTQTLADGSHIVNRSSSMIYRDSEGRERREQSIGKLGAWSAEGAPATAIFISDPVAKVSYSLNPKEHTARKMPAPATLTISAPRADGGLQSTKTILAGGGRGDQFFVEQRMITPGGSPKREDLGTQTMEGVAAQGTRTTVIIPAGQIGNERDVNIISERWYSPELQVVVMSKHSDPRTGETTYRLTNINRTEPLRSMFEVPADYTISSEGTNVRKLERKEDQ